METSFVSLNNRSSKGKTLALVALAVVGTFAACYLVFNQPSQSSMIDVNPTALYDLYSHWKKTYGLTYGGPEDQYRFGVFGNNYKLILSHNAKTDSSYKLGLNQFASLTKEEYAAIYLGFQGSRSSLRSKKVGVNLMGASIPDTVDWDAQGKVTPIKNQGQCGSCWAFSTTGSVESRLAIAKGKLVSLSEQQLVDCSGSYGNQGCNGGLMDQGFEYVKAVGLVAESDYPYKAVDGKCNIPANVTKYKISDYKDVTADDSQSLLTAIADGPVSVAIEADTSAFQFYSSGVLTSDACGTQLDHGVLAVGYGTLNGTKYIKVKNSWGASWGLKGYILLAVKDNEGECGINEAASYPIA